VFYKEFIEAYNAFVENKEPFVAKCKEQLNGEDLLGLLEYVGMQKY
jgi:hypothetical protein